MFSLVKFDDEEYFITLSKKVKIGDDEDYFIKYRGTSYHGYLVETNDSQAKLRALLESLKFKQQELEVVNSIHTTLQGLKEKKIFNEHNDSQMIEGLGYSTPVNKVAHPFGDQMRLSIVQHEIQTINLNPNSSTESGVASGGAKEIMDFIGDEWPRDSNRNKANEKANTANDNYISSKCSREKSDTDKVNNESDKSVNEEERHKRIDSRDVNDMNDDHNDENCDSEEENTLIDEDDGEVRMDSDYMPSFSVSTGTLQDITNASTETSAKKNFAVSLLKNIPPIDSRQLRVCPSKEDNKRTTKKHFCPYCKKLQTKFARHIELRHKTESDVLKFIHYPKGNPERAKIIEVIRKRGNFLHNTNPFFNTGNLIPCRQPQRKFNSIADDYICCNHCRGFFSKRTLRLHYRKCNVQCEKGARGILSSGRRLTGYIHHRANYVLRYNVFPSFNDDEVSRSIKYDELLILFGNKLCDKYTHTHQYDMIRSNLRILGRFKCAIKRINKDITDFASIFQPRFYDDTIVAIRECAKYDPLKKLFRAPSNASMLGTLLKKCGRLLSAECLKKGDEVGKKAAENFILLYDDDFPTTINKKVMEDQITQKRQKKVVLPLKKDIQRLNTYLKNNCQKAMKVLEAKFDLEEWKKLTESSLILLQMFNRRRAGEIERLLITDYENRETIDKNVNPDLYQKLSEESQVHAKQYERLTIRGKLGRTVPVLLHTTLIMYINTILTYRHDAGVMPGNEYVFAVPHTHSLKKNYLRACPLMRKFSNECGALIPSSLRGTTLRKHIATYTAMLRIEDCQVSDLANCMGHDKQIHKDVYRVPTGLRDMTDVSRLLQAAMGDSDDNDREEDSDQFSNDSDLPLSKAAFDAIPRRNIYIDSSASTSYGTRGNSLVNDQRNVEDNSSTTKRRSTSPYGKTKRVMWSHNEKEAVTECFGDPSKLSELPSLEKCQAVIEKYDALQKRTPAQLKSWIDNQRKSEKRKAAYSRRS